MNTRRAFLKTSALITSGLLANSARQSSLAAPAKSQYKAGIIGRTGRGNYGHGFELVFQGLENVSVEAIADPDPEGLKNAAQRSGAKRQYLDFREMFAKEKLDLVSIAPRQPDCHREMALAAIEAGAHIYMEKPMTESVAEADDIVQAAERKGIKIGIGHTRRFTLEFTRIKALLDEGFLGAVLEFRTQGKQDARAGGEDLIVLGTHDFDFMRMCFGDPLWCMASVTVKGRDFTRDDVRHGHEPIWVAGDTIRAMFAFPNQVQCYWNSVRASDHWNTNFSKREKWSFTIHGTKRILAYQSGIGAVYLDSPFLAHLDNTAVWKQIPDPQNASRPEHQKHPIRNLIHAIETDSQPLCNARDGRWTIEMVSAIYQSAKAQARIAFPLQDRRHPLLNS